MGVWGGGSWKRKHLFLIKWAIINEAFFIYWHEFMVAFRMELLLIFMLPPSLLSLKGKKCFGPKYYRYLFF